MIRCYFGFVIIINQRFDFVNVRVMKTAKVSVISIINILQFNLA